MDEAVVNSEFQSGVIPASRINLTTNSNDLQNFALQEYKVIPAKFDQPNAGGLSVYSKSFHVVLSKKHPNVYTPIVCFQHSDGTTTCCLALPPLILFKGSTFSVFADHRDNCVSV